MAENGWFARATWLPHGSIDYAAQPIYQFPPGEAFQYSYVTDSRPRTIYYDEVACKISALSNIDAIRDPGA